jgi:hypothetical protein
MESVRGCLTLNQQFNVHTVSLNGQVWYSFEDIAFVRWKDRKTIGQRFNRLDNEVKCLIDRTTLQVHPIKSQKGRMYVTKDVAIANLCGDDITFKSQIQPAALDARPAKQDAYKALRSLWQSVSKVDKLRFRRKVSVFYCLYFPDHTTVLPCDYWQATQSQNSGNQSQGIYHLTS